MANRFTSLFTNAATGTTLRTLIQIVPDASTSATLIEFGISFDGTSATATPALVEVVRQSTAGTSSAGTVTSWIDGQPGSADSSTLISFTSTDPTRVAAIAQWKVSPTSGLVVQWPLGREPSCIGTTNRLAVSVTVPGTGVNAWGYVVWEE